jgi:hypothetical protein
MEIHGSGGFLEALRDTLRGALQAGSYRLQTFTRAFVVPREDRYLVRGMAELGCDVYTLDNEDIITECVDLNDIEVVKITNPNTLFDNVGASLKLEVEIKNWSLYDAFDNLAVYAEIDGNPLLTETIRLLPDTTTICVFNTPYTVPAANSYTIKVYIGKRDINPANDTIEEIRKTDNGIINPNAKDFALGQNIPNPAKDNTRIDYNIPQDGQVIFTVYTITGQTLHIEKQDAGSGKNSIDFNTTNLANGVYYYSMEYKGERLVKKMTIRK